MINKSDYYIIPLFLMVLFPKYLYFEICYRAIFQGEINFCYCLSISLSITYLTQLVSTTPPFLLSSANFINTLFTPFSRTLMNVSQIINVEAVFLLFIVLQIPLHNLLFLSPGLIFCLSKHTVDFKGYRKRYPVILVKMFQLPSEYMSVKRRNL